MKNKFIYIIIGILFAWQGISSCSDDDIKDGSIYDNLRYPDATEVDKWIGKNYVDEYNIEVLYRWKDIESDFNHDIVPPVADTIVPFLRVVEKMWLKVYIDLTSEDIMKPIFPKQLLLVGSAAWNENTVTLGTAEGGRKMVLYQVNSFDPQDSAILKSYSRILYHEFGHILCQNIRYDFAAFKDITPSDYTATWTSNSDAVALNSGFVTPYSMQEPDEDFVEVLANYVIRSAEEWERLLSGANEDGRSKIEAKVGLVRTYMEDTWKIDLDNLRAAFLTAIDEIRNGNY